MAKTQKTWVKVQQSADLLQFIFSYRVERQAMARRAYLILVVVSAQN